MFNALLFGKGRRNVVTPNRKDIWAYIKRICICGSIFSLNIYLYLSIYVARLVFVTIEIFQTELKAEPNPSK